MRNYQIGHGGINTLHSNIYRILFTCLSLSVSIFFFFAFLSTNMRHYESFLFAAAAAAVATASLIVFCSLIIIYLLSFNWLREMGYIQFSFDFIQFSLHFKYTLCVINKRYAWRDVLYVCVCVYSFFCASYICREWCVLALCTLSETVSHI